MRLLLVDDDEVDRLAVRRALAQAGLQAEVTEATDANAGVEWLQRSSFECVLLDFQMPGRDGLWALRAIRSSGIFVPVVMLTGQGDERIAVELMKAGATDYLPKTALSPERLSQSVRHAVRVQQAEREANRAAKELDEERQRFRIALDATNLGTWDFNPVMGSMLWDSRCKQLFGLSPEAGVDKDVILKGVHSEDRERVLTRAIAALNPDESKQPFDIEFRTVGIEDGVDRWCRATGRALVEHGKTVRFIGTIQDVSDRKRQEEAERNQAEFQQRLIGIVSHDLRNPISAMMMSAVALLKREDMDPRVTKGLARIVTSGERAARLIRDLLDFTQASLGGGIPIQSRASDLNEVARQVVDEVQQAHPDREVFFETNGDGQGEWDPDRIAQVATNLAANAIAYSPPETPVRVCTRNETEEVVLEVHNGGRPISAALMPNLFEPFRRGREDQTTPMGNIGLGLFIVDQVVRAHGGTVRVRSSEAEGTTFTVRLPRRQPASMFS